MNPLALSRLPPSPPRRRRRTLAPTIPKPATSRAQTSGSGTALNSGAGSDEKLPETPARKLRRAWPGVKLTPLLTLLAFDKRLVSDSDMSRLTVGEKSRKSDE